MTAIKIDKGVPLPPRGNGLFDAMRAMQVGDSFLVPDEAVNTVRTLAGAQINGKFSIRRTPDGHRCWRTA